MELAFWNGLKTVFYDIWTINRWRPVVGYEGLYEVDWLCNVRTLNWQGTGRTKIIAANLRKDGYLQVNLSKNGIREQLLNHRVGMEAWIPNPENKRCVNHKTHVKTDNNVFTELEWATHKENTKDAQEFGSFANMSKGEKHSRLCAKGEKHGRCKFSDATIDRVHELRALGHLLREISKELSMSPRHVSYILSGKLRNHQENIF
jgi:hypothetical protein